MSDSWEDRMAGRAKARREVREEAERVALEAERAALEAGNPALSGESDLIEYGEHKGHRTHIFFPWHGNGVFCQCGALMGCFTVVIEGDGPDRVPCPVCIARGVGTWRKHVHEWADAEVGCADCGSHPAVRCTDPQCDSEPIDLIYNEDPREVPHG